jgi:hypothetical protein
MPDEHKMEYIEANVNLKGTPKGDESESPQRGQSSQVIDKGFKGPNEEPILLSELKKLNIEQEVKVPFKRLNKCHGHSLQNNVRQRNNQKTFG